MTCGSSFCNKKNSFCFNCDMKLSIDVNFQKINVINNKGPLQSLWKLKPISGEMHGQKWGWSMDYEH